MSEDLEKLRAKRKLSTKGATFSLIAAMFTMAVWGWTPLKDFIPALYVLIIFFIFVVFAVSLTILSMYREMKLTAMKAKIADS